MVLVQSVKNEQADLVKKPEEKTNSVVSFGARMEPKLIRQLCMKQELYSTPELNDKLYLHFQSFVRIENLEEYTQVRALFLDSNAIEKVENIQHMTQLKCLYLQNNNVHSIDPESLKFNTELVTLNLSNNFIQRIENISHLTHLSTLILSQNRLTTIDDIHHLTSCHNVTTLDLSRNRLEDPDVIDTLAEMRSLACLYLKGNPLIAKMRFYRKRTISKLQKLTYLDDRPVSDHERRLVEAWAQGGSQAEADERRRIGEEKMASAEDVVASRKRYEARLRAWRSRQENETGTEEDRVFHLNEETMKTLSVTYETIPDTPKNGESQTVPENGMVKDSIVNDASGSVPEEDSRFVGSDEENSVEEGFPWSQERDDELLQLVRRHLYDFKRVAAAMSQRFALVINEEQCRERFSKLNEEKNAASSFQDIAWQLD